MGVSAKSRNTARKNAVYISVTAVIILAVALYIFIKYDAARVLTTISGVNPLFVTAGLSMLFVQLYSESFCYGILLRKAGIKKKLSRLSGYAGTDLFYSNISPAQLAGLPAAGVAMYRDGVSVSASCPCLAAYSMCNRFAALVIASASAAAFPYIITGAGSALFLTLFVYGAAVNLAIVGLFVVALFSESASRAVIGFVMRLLGKIKFLKISSSQEDIDRISHDYISAAAMMRTSPLTGISVLAVCVFKRIANFAVVYFAYRAFGLGSESFFYIVAVQSVLAVSAESVPIPGSAGVSEAMFTVLYGDIFGARLYIAAMIVVRAMNYFALLLVSGGYSYWLHCSAERRE